MLRVAQQTRVIELHQDVRTGKIIAQVEPRNFVEVQRAGRARDDVTPKLDVLSLVCKQRLFFWIHVKVIFWIIKEGPEGKSNQIIQVVKQLNRQRLCN